jgi:acyl-CoA reductase-like NAD-dependent aldehyde dehydrogenase
VVVAAGIDSGTVRVNRHLDLSPDIPFGSARHSGMGSELGQDGLAEFTQRRIINIAKA